MFIYYPMDHLDFVNTSLRLRYEAFSTFATQINQASTLEEIGQGIAAHLKFVLDAFMFRLGATISQETYTLELFRGQCAVDTPKSLSAFEQQCLTKELPLTLSSQDIQQEHLLRNSLFDHPKVTTLMVLPFHASGEQQMVLSIANNRGGSYTEIDFRFARLIVELLSTKISQLLLIRKIASKNDALEHANQQLCRLNSEVQVLNTELESKVEERTLRLQEAHEELNTLLYRTSHDFRRPLTSMLGLAQLLTTTQSPDERIELIQHLKTTVNGLDRMLLKLQTLILVEIDEKPSPVNFVELAEEIKQKFQIVLKDDGIRFSYRADPAIEFTSHRPIQWAILENLVENAIHFHRSTKPIVQLLIEADESFVTIQVIDNGEGIPEYLQPVVFNMYTKASNRTQGNGLGLFVVRKLVNALGGTIRLTSVPGEGSTFTVKLPNSQDRTDKHHRETTTTSGG